MTGFSYVWEYRVRPEHRAEFERDYGAGGAWARLFARDPAYRGTRLLRDRDDPERFLTVDLWDSREACMAFRERHRVEFDAVDARGEGWTASERQIGEFDLLA